MDRLAHDWSQRLEAEAVACEYQNAKLLQEKQQLVATQPLHSRSTSAEDGRSKVSGPDRSLPIPRYSGTGTDQWQNIEIVFLSDLRVQIRINSKQSEPTTYAELGFADGRTENPNKAWVALRSLAENHGVLKDGNAVGEPWRKVEKRIRRYAKFSESFSEYPPILSHLCKG